MWENENDKNSYDLKVLVTGSTEDIRQIKEQLLKRLFKILDESDSSITAIFTGEWLAATNKMRQLKNEGWE